MVKSSTQKMIEDIILNSLKDSRPIRGKTLQVSKADGQCYHVQDFKAFLSAAGLKLNSNQMSGTTHGLKLKGFVSYRKQNQYRITEAGKKFLQSK